MTFKTLFILTGKGKRFSKYELSFQILTMKKWHNLGEEAHASVASGKKAGCIEAEET